ncbi:aldo/keto reductase [Aquimarina sp. D1M17]|uniref:aldo/keto reductase n=1 Tax=Aquimarina acroporae TaxID=2937283 RepID=UPI0020BE9D2E|nr:aldo/keto reductase [Aquimarina acroporae]MCK8521282.1 aldo/keto reductase [Aquimarina acroporae]
MQYRRMGNTGLQLSALSFGSWVSFHKQIDGKLADRLMGIAYDNGVNFFDNAETYALGESEKMMGRVIKNKNWERSSFVVSSKAFFGWHGKDNKPNQVGLSRKHLIEACNEALQRLQVEYLDLYFCHRPDENTPIEEVVWTMNMLIQQGKILYWGTSEWSGVQIMEARRVAQQYNLIGPKVEQSQYNLLKRDKIENEFKDIYKNIGLGTTVWSPLAAGFLTGKYLSGVPEGSRFSIKGMDWLSSQWLKEEKMQQVQKLQNIADELSVSLASLAIAWTLKNPNVSSTILGATKEEQLIQNLKALDVIPLLTNDVLENINDITTTG